MLQWYYKQRYFIFISDIIKLDYNGRKFFITKIIQTIINYSLS